MGSGDGSAPCSTDSLPVSAPTTSKPPAMATQSENALGPNSDGFPCIFPVDQGNFFETGCRNQRVLDNDLHAVTGELIVPRRRQRQLCKPKALSATTTQPAATRSASTSMPPL